MTDGESGTAAPATSAEEIIRRTRRRAAAWGWAACVLWILAGAGAVACAWAYFTFLHPSLAKITSRLPDLGESDRETLKLILGLLPRFAMPAVVVWASLVASAALSTLLFVNASRNAALAQIRDGLRELSGQIRRLGGPPPPVGA